MDIWNVSNNDMGIVITVVIILIIFLKKGAWTTYFNFDYLERKNSKILDN